MRTVSLRPSQLFFLATLVTLSGFFGGALSGRVFAPREALAQGRPLTTTINVGQQGLLFRAADGRVIARLSSDPTQGGVFELYNASERPGARLRAGALTGTLDVYPSAAPIAPPTIQPIAPGAASPAIARDMGF
jgi:hypothetical protein